MLERVFDANALAQEPKPANSREHADSRPNESREQYCKTKKKQEVSHQSAKY
jgi:hypothetical protein